MIKLSASMVDWSELTQDILLVILGKLILGKEPNWFGCVCRSWRTVAVDFLNHCAPYGAPCLIVRDRSSKSRRLLGLPGEKNIIDGQECYPQIGVPCRDVCCGSHEGWLVMINKNMEWYLLNPFSNIRIDLPPLLIHRSKCKFSVCSSKVILSTTPTASSDCLVVVVYRYRGMDFCKLGDEAWRCMDRSFSERYTHSFIDAIYFEGQVWTVSASGEIFVFDLTAPEPKITKYFPAPWEQRRQYWHLVECRGEILRIFRKLEFKPFNNINESVFFGKGDEEDAHNNVLRCQDIMLRVISGSLEVYKLDNTRVQNLDGDAVFIGTNQSFSLSNPKIFGFQGNRIYFTDYGMGLLYHDMGIFNLEDGTVESLYKTNSNFIDEPPRVWIVRKS